MQDWFAILHFFWSISATVKVTYKSPRNLICTGQNRTAETWHCLVIQDLPRFEVYNLLPQFLQKLNIHNRLGVNVYWEQQLGRNWSTPLHYTLSVLGASIFNLRQCGERWKDEVKWIEIVFSYRIKTRIYRISRSLPTGTLQWGNVSAMFQCHPYAKYTRISWIMSQWKLLFGLR